MVEVSRPDSRSARAGLHTNRGGDVPLRERERKIPSGHRSGFRRVCDRLPGFLARGSALSRGNRMRIPMALLAAAGVFACTEGSKAAQSPPEASAAAPPADVATTPAPTQELDLCAIMPL